MASCAEKGFEAPAVEDLLRISGVSRATFYEQFDDKLDCFRAAEDEIIAGALAATSQGLGRDGEAIERVRAGLEAFVRLVESERRGELSDLVTEATVGAILGVLFEAVRSGRPEDLPRLAPSLTYLVLSPFIGAEAATSVATGRGRAG